MSSSWPDHHSVSYKDVFRFTSNTSIKCGNSHLYRTSSIITYPTCNWTTHAKWLEALKLFSRGYKAPWKEVCGVSCSYCHTIAVLCAEIETLCSWLFSQTNSLSSGGKCSIPKSLWDKHTVWKGVFAGQCIAEIEAKKHFFPFTVNKGSLEGLSHVWICTLEQEQFPFSSHTSSVGSCGSMLLCSPYSLLKP